MIENALVNPYGATKQNFLMQTLSLRRRIITVCFGIIGFVLPMFYGFANGFPIPYIHDEFSYLLAADTFASGRMTNATPALYEHFESPHLLLTPSYASKYPPMQGIFLAIGQGIFGHPIFGVWISCGLAAASLYWMLLAWTRPKWAFLGSFLMVLCIGFDSYWAQSYWGGMLAFAGASLFFGGFRRLFKKLNFATTLLMILGGVMLVNARPFEGFITMLPALFMLFIHLLNDKKNQISTKFLQVVLPGFLLTSFALSTMAYYNFRVTGKLFQLPYSEHQKQYYPTPVFIFQATDEEATKGHKRLRTFYDNFTTPTILKELFELDILPDSNYLRPLYAYSFLLVFTPYFLLGPPIMILFYLMIPLLVKRNKWLALIAATILFTFACMSLATWWDNYHYAAPLVCCFYLLAVEGIRQFITLCKKQRKGLKNITIYALMFVLLCSSVIYSCFYVSEVNLPSRKVKVEDNINTKELTFDKPIVLTIPGRAIYLKPDIEESVGKLPNKYLAIVSYDTTYSYLDEIVFNKADLENSTLIWAYDLGKEKNEALLNYYQSRKIIRIKISNSQFEIIPTVSE